MDIKDLKKLPIDILLVASYFTFFGVYILTFASLNNDFLKISCALIGTFYIIISSSIMLYKKWAYTVAFVISIIGSFISLYLAMVFFSLASYTGNIVSFFVIFILFVLNCPVAYILNKHKALFIDEPQPPRYVASQMDSRVRYCPNCGRKIVFADTTEQVL